MSKVHVHKTTKAELAGMQKSLPHALLLFGSKGVGLRTVAWNLAKSITKEAYISEVLPSDTGTITIEVVRSLYRQTRAKQQAERVVIIDDADGMSQAAQNAFLKLLEEPVNHVHFLLTSHQTGSLLPTIRSRVQQLEVRPVETSVTLQIITASNTDSKMAAQLRFMADGLPAELHRLLNDQQYRQTKTELAEKAKSFISAKRSDKLLLVNKLSTNRADARLFVTLLLRMLQLQLKKQQDTKLLDHINTLISINDQLENNGHVRTQLLRAVV